jgi:hypothetical protein
MLKNCINIVKLGKNSFTRECYKSSVTIPLEQTFRELEKGERASPSESDPGRSHQFKKNNLFKIAIFLFYELIKFRSFRY